MANRPWADDEYSRIYWTIVDDEKFAEVFWDDARWAAYTRLLMAAEQAYPSPAHLPRWLADDVLEHLVESRIVETVGRSAYRVVGLQAEREGRLSGNRVGGKARATQAERDEHGRFLAGQTLGFAGDAGASLGNGAGPASLDSSEPARRGRDSDEDKTRRESSSRERANGAERADVAALRDRGWKRVTAKQRKVLDEVLARHDVTGPEFAAEAIRNAAEGEDPLEAVMKADRLWQESQRRRGEADERGWQATKDQEAKDAARILGTDSDDRPDWARPVEARG